MYKQLDAAQRSVKNNILDLLFIKYLYFTDFFYYHEDYYISLAYITYITNILFVPTPLTYIDNISYVLIFFISTPNA